MDEKCQSGELSRREFLELGALGTAGLILGADASALGAPSAEASHTVPPHTSQTAKSVIQIWLWGGASHLDTFDPKPGAGRDYCGPYAKSLATNVPGIEISPMLPMLAKMADKYALLRGMTHNNNSHETAAYLMQAGRKPGNGLVYPGIGAVTSYFKGYNGGYKGMLPPYITVTSSQGRFSESGFLGSRYKPFATGGDPARDPFAVEGVVSAGISEQRQRDRRALLGELDTLGHANPGDPAIRAFATAQEQAYEMILGSTGKVFALQMEKAEVRDRYGRNKFGQSCLLARRLVAQGVPFVTINYPGWDTHKQHFQIMGQKLPELDRALSALLQDLSDQGLLDSTIVWVGGEFGRSPQVQTEAPWDGGRNHYGKAFSVLVAGGGFRGGRVVGRTDERGETVVQRPIYPWDLLGSFYHLLGIDPSAKLQNPLGGEVPVSPFAAGEISAAETGGILREIMG